MAANQNFQGQPCSAIEAVWPQNETITQGILQYLNLRDVWNMRKTNSNMNVLLQGHSRPLNPNTTLSFIAARCDESRTALHPDDPPVRCTNGPRQDVLMKYCEDSHRHGKWDGGPFNVCQDCLNHNIRARDEEEGNILLDLRRGVCETCREEEQNVHPGGCNTCVCKAQMRSGWKCDSCSGRQRDLIKRIGGQRASHRHYHYRDQNGRIYFGPFRRMMAQACRCGRTLSPAELDQMAVRWCLGCKRVLVAPWAHRDGARRSARMQKEGSR